MSAELRNRAVTALAVLSLLGAGFLLGSFWLEWRDVPLGSAADTVRSSALDLPAGWDDRVRVEVLNGFGRPGAARAAAEILREMGFDVVYFGNASSFDHDTTLVLLRSEDRSGVRRVADSLGVVEVSDRPEPALHLDGTVVLGADWRERIEERRRRQVAGEEARDPTLLEALRERLGL